MAQQQQNDVTRREFVASAAAGVVAAAAAAVPAAGAADVGGGAATRPDRADGESRRERDAALHRTLDIDVPLNPDWPVLSRYDGPHLARVAMPIGGIGTGCISLAGRGALRDWELVNKPAYGYQPIHTFFALWCKSASGQSATRCLEGPLPLSLYEGAHGSPIRNHSLPRFRRCAFAAAYPLGQVLLSDPDVPLKVRIEAFNPLVPGDPEGSGIPVAVLRFVLINPTDAPVEASVCGTVENFIGWDGSAGKAEKNVNEFRGGETGGNLCGLFMRTDGLDPKAPAWGTLALASTWAGVESHRTDWAELSWGDTLLDFWDDFSADGKLDPRTGSKRPAPFASLAPRLSVPANGQVAVTFLIAWHFPNRLAWNPPHERVGNHYCTQYQDAWDVITQATGKLHGLERRTVQFAKAVVDSDVPAVIKDACLANASTLKTQTVFRTEDGRFFGWEGCNDNSGCCHGSCTHVWNYEQTTPHLFGGLARDARRTEFNAATDKRGLMSFRINLPLSHANEYQHAAADGQMGTIVRLYREWRLCGDDALLNELYPHAKRALEFAWIPGGWDADRDGVMEGCQHNTMDVEYFGPNPEINAWYLAALRAMEEMARHLADAPFADTCADLAKRGGAWMDHHLFNGEYYEQHIVPGDLKKIAPGLTNSGDADKAANPVLQIGSGCLADQLAGQYAAHVCGLGYLLSPDNVRATMQSIMRHNFRDNFWGHFNHFRSYALGDDQGLLIATYPKGRRPQRPFPYANEAWTGIEYTAAAGMLFEGQTDDALRVISAARDRHDGQRRNPFDEEECGHHYVRAMAAWACWLAYTGLSWDARTGELRVKKTDRPATYFFSTGDAWGTLRQEGPSATLTLLGGKLPLKRLTVGNTSAPIDAPPIGPGKTVTVKLT